MGARGERAFIGAQRRVSLGALLIIIIFALGIVAVLRAMLKASDRIQARAADPQRPVDLSMLPERFVVFDLETTGLSSDRHEIIEIGAIRVRRESEIHDTFQTLVIPKGRISAKITELTGLTRKKLLADGMAAQDAIEQFREFVGDLPMIAYNSEFDAAFVQAAATRAGLPPFGNEMICALKMARRAWPRRDTYRLSSLAFDAGLPVSNLHRALDDAHRALLVYAAAARKLGRHK